MSFYRETMAYLHKLIYLRLHGNIADPASDHPLGKDPLGIRDEAFCHHRGTVMNPERNDVRIERAIWALIGSKASLNKVNGASRPATPWGLVLIFNGTKMSSSEARPSSSSTVTWGFLL